MAKEERNLMWGLKPCYKSCSNIALAMDQHHRFMRMVCDWEGKKRISTTSKQSYWQACLAGGRKGRCSSCSLSAVDVLPGVKQECRSCFELLVLSPASSRRAGAIPRVNFMVTLIVLE